jgi:UDP-N-acetylmuramyl pentapeptide phosphotransferase/UDP-N-acetylglucosamine-1-phosphate transferase
MDNRIYEYLSVFIMAWMLVYGLTPFIIRMANALNFVDKPEARKIHTEERPVDGRFECGDWLCAQLVYMMC